MSSPYYNWFCNPYVKNDLNYELDSMSKFGLNRQTSQKLNVYVAISLLHKRKLEQMKIEKSEFEEFISDGLNPQ